MPTCARCGVPFARLSITQRRCTPCQVAVVTRVDAAQRPPARPLPPKDLTGWITFPSAAR